MRFIMKNELVQLQSILVYRGLSSGYSFRGKIKNIHNGGVRVIQMKDFENEYSTIGDECVFVDSQSIKTKYYLEDGDILFIAKGSNNYAVVYNKMDVPTIASSALFILKVDRDKATPEFVAWYINQQDVQNYFKSNEAGTYATSINRKTLEEVPVKLPSLELQSKIATVASLHLREQLLNRKVSELRDTLITNQLINSI